MAGGEEFNLKDEFAQIDFHEARLEERFRDEPWKPWLGSSYHRCRLGMAVTNHTAQDRLVFHSDRGIQYCAQLFRESLRAHCPSVRQSMSRKGNCWDNACAESFFKTLKTELETVDGKYSQAEVRAVGLPVEPVKYFV